MPVPVYSPLLFSRTMPLDLKQLINRDSVLCNVSARSKKHSLEILSELLTRQNPDIAAEEVFTKLVERERLGCTSLNRGVAFPHCRVIGLHRSVGALLKLTEPVDFDSHDGQSVDLIFGLMVPLDLEDDDLSDIYALSRILSDDALTVRLRESTCSNDLCDSFLSRQIDSLPEEKSGQQG